MAMIVAQPNSPETQCEKGTGERALSRRKSSDNVKWTNVAAGLLLQGLLSRLKLDNNWFDTSQAYLEVLSLIR